jgi:hypothetical protein
VARNKTTRMTHTGHRRDQSEPPHASFDPPNLYGTQRLFVCRRALSGRAHRPMGRIARLCLAIALEKPVGTSCLRPLSPRPPRADPEDAAVGALRRHDPRVLLIARGWRRRRCGPRPTPHRIRALGLLSRSRCRSAPWAPRLPRSPRQLLRPP